MCGSGARERKRKSPGSGLRAQGSAKQTSRYVFGGVGFPIILNGVSAIIANLAGNFAKRGGFQFGMKKGGARPQRPVSGYSYQ